MALFNFYIKFHNYIVLTSVEILKYENILIIFVFTIYIYNFKIVFL